MSTYIQRQCDEPATPTHWVRGVSSTDMSHSIDEILPEDVADRPQPGYTAAALSSGVYYYLDEDVITVSPTGNNTFSVAFRGEHWGTTDFGSLDADGQLVESDDEIAAMARDWLRENAVNGVTPDTRVTIL